MEEDELGNSPGDGRIGTTVDKERQPSTADLNADKQKNIDQLKRKDRKAILKESAELVQIDSDDEVITYTDNLNDDITDESVNGNDDEIETEDGISVMNNDDQSSDLIDFTDIPLSDSKDNLQKNSSGQRCDDIETDSMDGSNTETVIDVEMHSVDAVGALSRVESRISQYGEESDVNSNSKVCYSSSSDSDSDSGDSWTVPSEQDNNENESVRKGYFDNQLSQDDITSLSSRGRLKDMFNDTVSEANIDLYYLENEMSEQNTPRREPKNKVEESVLIENGNEEASPHSTDEKKSQGKNKSINPAMNKLEMEERNAGGSVSKDKKYVLYTVVGDDRSRVSSGSWALRVLLGSLMVIALAVVPYVSLRIAQANSRTLVVFQPVPVHNRSTSHHGNHRSSIRSKTIKLMEVADLRLENYTANASKLNSTGKMNETDVLEMLSNTTSSSTGLNMSLPEANERNNATTTIQTSENVTGGIEPTEKNISNDNTSDKTMAAALENANDSNSSKLSASTEKIMTLTSSSSKLMVSTSNASPVTDPVSSTKDNERENSEQTTPLPQQKILAHKLVYVATSSSGNHVGGICIWKTDKNITNWSYFYDNIPIEYQSGHDAGDHEIRTTVAAVRTWATQWQDAHVTLRSQHNAIEDSELPVRNTLVKELEKASIGHFTYELEWRLPEADSLVRIANSLSRLHQDYKFWFGDFKKHVDSLLGEQDWDEAVKTRHVKVIEDSFFTEESDSTKIESSDADSEKVISSTIKSSSVPVQVTLTPKPLLHKLVYVATSASGNHVGGFCVWKVDKNVTDWAYFYDNIPVEYQSNHDSADHEQRALLAALRVWSDKWQDAHVTLRSQHAALDRSDGLVKKVLLDSLEKASEGHFTYDLEWRLRKAEGVVKASFCLSRLHRNFGHWFAVFKASVDDIMGPQNWDEVTKSKRVLLTDDHFFTNESHSEISDNSLTATLAELGH